MYKKLLFFYIKIVLSFVFLIWMQNGFANSLNEYCVTKYKVKVIKVDTFKKVNNIQQKLFVKINVTFLFTKNKHNTKTFKFLKNGIHSFANGDLFLLGLNNNRPCSLVKI